MHGPTGSATGLGRCGVMEKRSPKAITRHLEFSGCGLTNPFSSRKSAGTLSEVMVGLRPRLAGFAQCTRSLAVPFDAVLLHVAHLLLASPVAMEGGLSTRPCPCICVTGTTVGQRRRIYTCAAVQFSRLLHRRHHQSSAGIFLECHHPSDALLYVFPCICWIVGGKICFTTTDAL